MLFRLFLFSLKIKTLLYNKIQTLKISDKTTFLFYSVVKKKIESKCTGVSINK